MGSIEDPQEMAPKDVLVHHSKDPLPLCRDSSELVRRCGDIILYLTPTTPLLPDYSLVLAHPIVWRLPDAEIILVELFGGIDTRLAVVLEVGLTVWRYVYMDNIQLSTCVACHHFHQLMVFNPQHLHLTAIRGCFMWEHANTKSFGLTFFNA